MPAPHALYYRARVNPLVDVQAHGRQFKRSVLRLASPNELRVKVRVVSVGLPARVPVCFRRHQADGRIVDSLFIAVCVLLNRLGAEVRLLRHSSYANDKSLAK